MIIIINNWRRKLRTGLKALVLMAVISLALVLVSRLFPHQVPVFRGFSQDKVPSGNPLRVDKSQLDEKIEQFVIKLQDFYYQERE